MTSSASTVVDSTVPWQFIQSGGYSQWLWHTQDFDALVSSESDRWAWEVKTSGSVVLAAGTGVDFDTSADQALEVVGKAFPLSAGYGRWTRRAASKYTLASGARVDLSDGDGRRVRVTLTDGQQVDGVLRLGQWMLRVEDDAGGVVRTLHPGAVTHVGRLA